MNRDIIRRILGIQPGRYVWVITKDHIASPDAKPGTNSNAVGVIGPSTAPEDITAKAIREHQDRQRFRLRDDDGETYYEGFFVDLTQPGDEDEGREGVSGFEPLDDFGEPNAGCTHIQYFRKGKGGGWETL